MIFKRWNQIRAWPFGYLLKNTGNPKVLSLCGSCALQLRLDLLLSSREFAPYNKTYLIDLSWHSLGLFNSHNSIFGPQCGLFVYPVTAASHRQALCCALFWVFEYHAHKMALSSCSTTPSGLCSIWELLTVHIHLCHWQTEWMTAAVKFIGPVLPVLCRS